MRSANEPSRISVSGLSKRTQSASTVCSAAVVRAGEPAVLARDCSRLREFPLDERHRLIRAACRDDDDIEVDVAGTCSYTVVRQDRSQLALLAEMIPESRFLRSDIARDLPQVSTNR